MFIAYYNPAQEQNIAEAKNPCIEKMVIASNKGNGFIRLRCADCFYRHVYNNYGNVCCPFGDLCKTDDWFCGHFKPGKEGKG